MRVIEPESEQVKAIFKEPLNKYVAEIEKMGRGIETTKKNQQVKAKQEIKEGGGNKDKDNFEDSLSQAIVKEKPNVKWTDIAGLDKAK